MVILGDWVRAMELEIHGTEGKSFRNEERKRAEMSGESVLGACLSLKIEPKASSENPSRVWQLLSTHYNQKACWPLGERLAFTWPVPFLSRALSSLLLLPSWKWDSFYLVKWDEYCSPNWCVLRISACALPWKCSVCRCNQAKIRSHRIRVGFYFVSCRSLIFIKMTRAQSFL